MESFPEFHRNGRRRAGTAALLALGCALVAPAGHAQPPLTTVSAVDTGPDFFIGMPGNVEAGQANVIGAVSVAASGVLGDRILWAFGDTRVIDPYSANLGDDTVYLIPSTYLHTRLDGSALPPYLSPRQLPYQLIRYTQAEWEYNSGTKSRDDRYGLWPSAVLSTDAAHVRILYTKAHVTRNADLDGPSRYDTVGTGFAAMTLADLQARRDFRIDADDGLTFRAGTRPFGRSGGAMIRGSTTDTVYLFDCTDEDGDNCYLARASAPHGAGDAVWGDLLADAANFQAWNGTQWTADLAHALPVNHLHASSYGWSMAWNAYALNPETGQAGAYVGVYNEAALQAGKRISTGNIKLVVAARPEGPWSDPVQAYYMDPNAGDDYFHYDLKQVHDVRLHPELDRDGGASIAVTVSAPNPTKYGAWRESIWAYRFKLQNVAVR